MRALILMLLSSVCFGEYMEPSPEEVTNQRKVIDEVISKANKLSGSKEFLDTIQRDMNTMNGIKPEHYSGGVGLQIPSYVDALKDSNYLNRVESVSADISSTKDPNDTPLVLVSFSMPDGALKGLIAEAMKFGGSVVIRGLYQNDFKKTLDKIRSLSDSENAGVAIDPTLFDRLNVNTVPTFVLPHGDVLPCSESGCPVFEHTRATGGNSFEYFLDVVSRTENDSISAIADKWLGFIRESS